MSVKDINRSSCTHAFREPADVQNVDATLLSLGVQPLSDLLAAVVFWHHMRDTLTARREKDLTIEDGFVVSGHKLRNKDLKNVGFLLELVLNVKTFFPGQLSEETSSTGSHFSLKKEQHNLWEFDGVCVLFLGGSSANFPSL